MAVQTTACQRLRCGTIHACLLAVLACTGHRSGNELTPSPGRPTARLKATTPAYVGDLVGFDASASSSPNGPLIAYNFNFGDGTSVQQGGPQVTHTFERAGEFSVILLVLDTANLNASATIQVAVAINQPPVAVLKHPRSVLPGMTVQFDASASSDPNGNIASYTFDFGDGSPLVSVQAPSTAHVYRAAGAFNAALTVTDDRGASSSAGAVVVVGVSLNDPVIVSRGPGLASRGAIAVDSNDNIDLTWDEGRGVHFEQFVPATGLVSVSAIVASDLSGPRSVALGSDSLAATSDLVLHVVWQWDGYDGISRITYASSFDGGANFTAPRLLDVGGAPTLRSRGTDEINIAYCGDGGNTRALFLRSLDGGASFGPPIAIGVNAGCPAMGLGAAGKVIMAAFDGVADSTLSDVFVYRSTDGGITFSNAVNVSHDSTLKSGGSIHVWSDGNGTVIVTWIALDAITSGPVEGGWPTRLMMARSTDDGATWEAPTAIVTAPLLILCATAVFDSEGRAYAAFSERPPVGANPRVPNYDYSYSFLAVSEDSAATFSTPLLLEEVPVETGCPLVAARRNQQIALFWTNPLLDPNNLPKVYLTTGTVRLR